VHTKSIRLLILPLVAMAITLGCSASSLIARAPEPTPTKTPRPTFTPTPTETPTPVVIPTEIWTPEPVTAPTEPALTDTPLPTDTPPPTPTPVPTDTPLPSLPTDTPVPGPPPTPGPPPPTDTPVPEVDFKIVEQRILSPEENKGGTDFGGDHLIFVTVIDANGVPLDGIVVREVNVTNDELITGNKGPGKTEFLMGGGGVFAFAVVGEKDGRAYTSETTHPLSLVTPVLDDLVVAGYCPDVGTCQNHPWHWSYNVVFQRTW
jgi:hypothetical protein